MISEISSRRRGWQTVGAFGDIGLFSPPTKDLRPRSSTVDCFLLSWSWSDHEGNQRPMTRVRANSPTHYHGKDRDKKKQRQRQRQRQKDKDKNSTKHPLLPPSQRAMSSPRTRRAFQKEAPLIFALAYLRICGPRGCLFS